MVDVREITDAELDRWLAVAGAVKPQGSREDMIDWRRQADDMTWLVAVEGGTDVGAGLGLVGWHSPRGVGFGEAFVPDGQRAHGVGTALFQALARWVSERGCIELESVVSEDDEASLAWRRAAASAR